MIDGSGKSKILKCSFSVNIYILKLKLLIRKSRNISGKLQLILFCVEPAAYFCVIKSLEGCIKKIQQVRNVICFYIKSKCLVANISRRRFNISGIIFIQKKFKSIWKIL